MDIHFELNGMRFVWNAKKAVANPVKHDGITFEQAATVLFDPLFELLEADRNDEVRDALIGYDVSGKLLFVVHIDVEGEFFRLISARRATNEERVNHEHS
ncbi:MAG: BrnT family toxin [Sulfuriferula sp.]|nr:BrnT family toxin [Sulfuriferula sp.]